MAHVLIVDDERLFREGLKTMIDDLNVGWTVCGTAANGESALQLYEQYTPELIITDIRMPHMDGLQLAKQLRLQQATVPIVFLTGYKQFEYAQEAIKNQAFDFLLKPCSKEQLLALFDKIDRQVAKHSSFYQVEAVPSAAPVDAVQSNLSRYSDPYVREAIQYIEQQYQSQCTLADAAESLYLSAGYLGKRFKLETGIPFSQYVIQYRMTKAMTLLQQTDYKIFEVAAQIGIEDSNYFSTMFKRQFGIAPSDVRRKQ